MPIADPLRGARYKETTPQTLKLVLSYLSQKKAPTHPEHAGDPGAFLFDYSLANASTSLARDSAVTSSVLLALYSLRT